MLNGPSLSPANGQPADSAVILLHGIGDSGAGLMDIAGAWASGLPQTAFFAPDAPFPYEGAPFGRQWFGLNDRSAEALLDGIRRASVDLNAFLDAVMERLSLPASRVALMGFSQGTMMSLYVAPRRAEVLAGVLGYSGLLIGGDLLAQEKRSSPPVLLVHGEEDEVVPFTYFRAALGGLKRAGLEVSSLACPNLGHSIDPAGLQAGLTFLQKVLA